MVECGPLPSSLVYIYTFHSQQQRYNISTAKTRCHEQRSSAHCNGRMVYVDPLICQQQFQDLDMTPSSSDCEWGLWQSLKYDVIERHHQFESNVQLQRGY